jgi:hypothetical protein
MAAEQMLFSQFADKPQKQLSHLTDRKKQSSK